MLTPGSDSQIVYLWILSEMTEIPKLVEVNHSKALVVPLQRLLYD